MRSILKGIKDFDPEQIFTSGQCFRWEKQNDGSYTGEAMGRVVNVKYISGTDVETAGHPSTGVGHSSEEHRFPGAPGVIDDCCSSEDADGGSLSEHDHRSGGAASEGCLIIDNCAPEEEETIWRQYFDLDRDYGSIKAKLAAEDPAMAEAIKYGWGIRILNQDPWETMLHFMISQNNNIPRIKGCIESLCRNFGEPVGELNGSTFYGAPSPEKLASLTADDLCDCRLGYRADYLVCAGRKVAEEGIEELEKYRIRSGNSSLKTDSSHIPASESSKSRISSGDSFSNEEAKEYLLSFKGIGPKVADCIMLFGLGRFSSFPIDVWVRRVMNRVYGIDEKNTKEMADYAAEHFGEYGGIAQQYLFYFIREMDKYSETG